MYIDVREAILSPHFDSHGRLDGGTIINGGKIVGHIDPTGEPGTPGISGVNTPTPTQNETTKE
jgi:hypothetical protein